MHFSEALKVYLQPRIEKYDEGKFSDYYYFFYSINKIALKPPVTLESGFGIYNFLERYLNKEKSFKESSFVKIFSILEKHFSIFSEVLEMNGIKTKYDDDIEELILHSKIIKNLALRSAYRKESMYNSLINEIHTIRDKEIILIDHLLKDIESMI